MNQYQTTTQEQYNHQLKQNLEHSDFIISFDYDMMMSKNYPDIMQNTITDMNPIHGSHTLTVAMEEFQELSIELIKQMDGHDDASYENLVEEYVDCFLNMPYLAYVCNIPHNVITNVTARGEYITENNKQFADMIYHMMSPNHPPRYALHIFADTTKALSKYMRGILEPDDLIPYLQDSELALTCICKHYNISTHDIRTTIDKKLKRMEKRMETGWK